MLKALLARLHQGSRTIPYPAGEPPVLPDRFRGAPRIDATKCPDGCRACVDACPTGAITAAPGRLAVDLGRCLFCTDCTQACPQGAIEYTRDFRLATRTRAALVTDGRALELARALDAASLRLFKRSLRLRQVSAGGCNGCEVEANVLQTVVFDLARFGVQFVASPRHADGLLITGPLTAGMRQPLLDTYAALPAPKLVIAMGACAISGGPYQGHPETHDGAAGLLPVDLFIPGCPPHPLTVLDGLLRLLDRMPPNR